MRRKHFASETFCVRNILWIETFCFSLRGVFRGVMGADPLPHPRMRETMVSRVFWAPKTGNEPHPPGKITEYAPGYDK